MREIIIQQQDGASKLFIDGQFLAHQQILLMQSVHQLNLVDARVRFYSA